MSAYDDNDEVCVVYEKFVPPVITPQKAEEIKLKARKNFYGVIENVHPLATPNKVISVPSIKTVNNSSSNESTLVDSTQPKKDVLVANSRIEKVKTVPNKSKKTNGSHLLETKEKFQLEKKNGKLKCSPVYAKDKTPGSKCINKISHHYNDSTLESTVKNLLASTSLTSYVVRSSVIAETGQLNNSLRPASTSNLRSTGKKKREGKKNGIKTVTNSVVKVSTSGNNNPIVPIPSLIVQSNLAANGTSLIPASSSMSDEKSLNTAKNKQQKEILKDDGCKQSVDASKEVLTHNLVPNILVKQEINTQDAGACKEVVITQADTADINDSQQMNPQVTPSKSIMFQKLSPQLKAHPRKFLSPSPGSSGKATGSRTKTLHVKRSPLKYSGRKNYSRMTVNSPAKGKVKKLLNFDGQKRNDQAETGDVSASLVSLTMDDIYCKSFKLILNKILPCFLLFSELELQTIVNFMKLSSVAQRLYIRMFSRKYCWHRVSEVSYENISTDLAPIVNELEFHDFVTLDYSGEQPRTLLGLLRAAELKALCLRLRVSVAATTKEDRVGALLRYGSKQQTLSPARDFSAAIRRETKVMLGECFKLCEAPRRLFQRVLLMFTLPQGQTGSVDVLPLLIMIHNAETRKIEFPKYKLSSSSVILDRTLFTHREQVVSFHDADDICSELMEAISKKDMVQILTLCNEVHLSFVQCYENYGERVHASSLPLFLRRFTACSKYAYALTIGAEALRKSKEKAHRKKAIQILELLLGQDLFLTHHRGFWYEKLSLTLHCHLHDFEKAADLIIHAMSDDHVTEVQKYDLVCRGHRIHNARNSGLSKQKKRELYLSLDDVMDDPPSITIKAKVLPVQGPGRKRVYVEVDEDTQQRSYSSVEEYAISYYKKQGYECGYHTEGSIVCSLFALMLWDVLYELDVCTTFLSNYQEVPPDLKYPEFYARRSDAIDDKLRQMEGMSVEQLQAAVTESYAKNVGTTSLVNWDLLRDVSRVTVLVACLGPRLLSRICERFAKNFRMARSGFPDLLVWSRSQKKCKIVEVKGPNDSLSGKQVLWLNYLIAAGADAEVCHVETTGSKAAKRKSSEVDDL
ncbi:fanconi-associated nuclease 1-like [Bacillus rossius redtenbacheri]|uniref:fanconi-associated nuclease 1-like n=1 Tax=Bacillus rossius redtenbacheri TaxID=93214 RepID=UPI002FDE04FA